MSSALLRTAVLVSLSVIRAVVALLYRACWQLTPSSNPTGIVVEARSTSFSLVETNKAALVAFAVVLAFSSGWQNELIALASAGFLLLSRPVASSDLLRHVGGFLILLIMGPFLVNAAMAATGLHKSLLSQLAETDIDLEKPFVMYLVSSVFRNIVGDNPAVMMPVPHLQLAENAHLPGAALSLGTHL